MIDLHCHILPGLDDGAHSHVESLEMAQSAVKDGIGFISATPHHKDGYYINDKSSVMMSVSNLNSLLKERGIPLTVFPGQEVHLYDALIDDLYNRDNILTINNSKYLLLEFDSSDIPTNIEEIMHEFRVLGIVPIIAHPERNKCIAKDPELLFHLISLGALAQVTSQSIVGKFGRKVQDIALELCRRNLIHVIASDAHNVKGRPFVMKEGYEVIRNKLGGKYEDYYKTNAELIVNNHEIEIMETDKKNKRLFFFWKKG